MPEDRKLLDYFIEHTRDQFQEIKTDLAAHRKESQESFAKLYRFGLIVVLLCVALSPAGAKILDMAPKLLELAASASGGR